MKTGTFEIFVDNRYIALAKIRQETGKFQIKYPARETGLLEKAGSQDRQNPHGINIIIGTVLGLHYKVILRRSPSRPLPWNRETPKNSGSHSPADGRSIGMEPLSQGSPRQPLPGHKFP